MDPRFNQLPTWQTVGRGSTALWRTAFPEHVNKRGVDLSASFIDLPRPTPDRVHWPWVAPCVLGDAATSAQNNGGLPTITVVTPSFNQGRFLEETIRSVLLQGYPNLDYVVIDGGSTDTSIDIIRRYEPWLSYWVSENDRGQCHAINKGFQRATGEIFCWLNSDDTFEPGALHAIAAHFILHPDWQVLTGSCYFIGADGGYLDARTREPLPGLRPPQSICRTPRADGCDTFTHWFRDWFPQSSTFWRRELWTQAGPLDESLHFSMDYELWRRMGAHAQIHVVPDVLSNYRFQDDAKCMLNQWAPSREVLAVNSRAMPDLEFRAYAEDVIPFLLDQLERHDMRHAHAQQLLTKVIESRRYRLGSALLEPIAAIARSFKEHL